MIPLIRLISPVDIGAVCSLLNDGGIPFYAQDPSNSPVPENTGIPIFVNPENLEYAQILIKEHLPFLSDSLVSYQKLETPTEDYNDFQDDEEYNEEVKFDNVDDEFENRFGYTFERLHPINRDTELENKVTPHSNFKYKEITPESKGSSTTPIADSIFLRIFIGSCISMILYMFKNCN